MATGGHTSSGQYRATSGHLDDLRHQGKGADGAGVATGIGARADGLPGGLGRLTDWGGAWARRAQSGQTHHYYSTIVIGVVLILSLLVIGGLL